MSDKEVYGCHSIEEFRKSVEESITFRLSGIGMVIMSLLSDSQEMIAHGDNERARQMINRVKHLVHHYNLGLTIRE